MMRSRMFLPAFDTNVSIRFSLPDPENSNPSLAMLFSLVSCFGFLDQFAQVEVKIDIIWRIQFDYRLREVRPRAKLRARAWLTISKNCRPFGTGPALLIIRLGRTPKIGREHVSTP